MASFQLLDAKEEEELYKTRLLNVEEKPFKRIAKRLATLNRVLAAKQSQRLATPPPEEEGAAAGGDEAKEGGQEKGEAGRKAAASPELLQLKEDFTLDFAAFDASISRLRFLAIANERERQRYAADRENILHACQTVRDNMTTLRGQLDQARATLAQRKIFDGLADRIIQSKTLRPRPDQQAAILKLEEECRQLQRESAAYSETWHERKEQFARIMDESMRLRRLIRDEKEEVERREGMDEDGGGGANAGSGGTSSGPGNSSAAATATAPAAGGGTPNSSSATPAVNPTTSSATAAATGGGTSLSNHESGSLYPQMAADGSAVAGRAGSRMGSRATSREPTPLPPTPAAAAAAKEGEDIDMDEAGDAAGGASAAATPSVATPVPIGTPHLPAADSTAADVGAEKMDTT